MFLRSIPVRIVNKKRFILKRFLIYFIILIIAAPFVYVFRYQIYSTFLIRTDDWYVRTDADGVPVAEYGYQTGVYVGTRYTPRVVANGVHGYYKQITEGNASAEAPLFNCVDWLMEHMTILSIDTSNGTKEIPRWYFDFAIWDMPAEWYQAMTDAKILGVFAIAFELTGNTTYLEMARNLVWAFEVPIAEGGNLYTFENGGSWYPEYIVPGFIDSTYEPKFILNGFLICLNDLFWANEKLNNTQLNQVAIRGAETAASRLHLYDSPYGWTLYHLDYPMKFASNHYHQIHIDHTAYLYEYTNITEFITYSQKWTEYSGPPSFTIEEILSPEFIYFGLVIAALILVPVFLIDVIQLSIRAWRKTGV